MALPEVVADVAAGQLLQGLEVHTRNPVLLDYAAQQVLHHGGEGVKAFVDGVWAGRSIAHERKSSLPASWIP